MNRRAFTLIALGVTRSIHDTLRNGYRLVQMPPL
jgi:hypothetical protein